MTQSDDWIYDQLWRMASATGSPVDLSGIDQDTTHRMLAIARVHGVLGIVLSKLRESPPPHAETWNIAQRAWKGEVVQSMRVRRHGHELMRAMSSGGIPAVIVKGPDFADHLFSDPKLRPSLDVDVLVPRDRWIEAAKVLQTIGHKEKPGQPGPFLPTGVLSERTWIFPSAGVDIEVDLHWSMVHFPFFRQQASVEYWNLDWHWQPGGKGELTAASRLVIAVVHALYHHQFEKLSQLCDIQLACRKITSDTDRLTVRALAERTGTCMALNVALQVTSRFLEDPEVERLRQMLLDGPGQRWTIPQGLFDDARKNLRQIRMHYMTPGRRRIREWMLRQPMRPQPGWEFKPAKTPAAAPSVVVNHTPLPQNPPNIDGPM
jgi:hypothetical protein